MSYDLNDLTIFAVQDRSGSVAQLTLNEALLDPVEVGDQGDYTGLNDGQSVTVAFTVTQVNDANNIVISTTLPDGAHGEWMHSRWPNTGTIIWLTGANTNASPNESDVIAMNVANAYITPEFLAQYCGSRAGLSYPSSPSDAIEQAIVSASDYIDARYRFKGIKLLQWFANPAMLPGQFFIDAWLGIPDMPFFGWMGVNEWMVPSATFTHTQWPRIGVQDSSGDGVYGIPLCVQQACAELTVRCLNGTILQPDYDPSIQVAGGLIESVSTTVGPINTRTEYDVSRGTGFFAEFPIVKRLLTSGGVLLANGGRTLIR
jgi:hypothetical protein